MKMKKIILYSICITLILSCSNTKQTNSAKNSDTITKYYYGEVNVTSPDGTIPYGPSKYSLVKRTIDKTNGTIVEYVIQSEETFDTKLKKIDESNVFDVSDSKNTFNGQITFSGGHEWEWKNWEYDIVLSDSSGKIIGTGTLDNKGIKTEKYFTDFDGNKTAKITEVLDEINEVEYNEKVPNTEKHY